MPHQLEDAGDRAQSFRESALRRIHLDELGIYPNNRGGTGIIPHHVHEVANDCLENTTKPNRYQHVCVVEVPEEFRKQVVDYNVQKARGNPLLPTVHPERLRYVVLTKTHFVHAQKLAKDGNRTLYDKGTTRINWSDRDREGHEITMRGPLCCVYRQGLYMDDAAAKTLCSEDNLNALVSMAEDEMQAFHRACAQFLVEEEKILQQHGEVEPHRQELEKAAVDGIAINGGHAPFSRREWHDLVAFRAGVPRALSELLQGCHAILCAGRSRVRIADWGLVAKLDRQAPWAKLCVMMMQYLGAMPTPDKEGSRWAGRKDHFATKLQKDVLDELQGESEFLLDVQVAVTKLITAYKDPTNNSMLQEEIRSHMYACRGHLMANAGKIVRTVGAELSSETKKKAFKKETLHVTDRIKIIEQHSKDKYGKLETAFRNELLLQGMFEKDTVPQRLFHDPSAVSKEKSPGGPEPTEAGPTDTLRFVVSAGTGTADTGTAEGGHQVRLTTADVLGRLGIQDFGEKVLVRWSAEWAVKLEAAEITDQEEEEQSAQEEPVLPAAEEEPAQPPAAQEQPAKLPEHGDGDWVLAVLLKLTPPDKATVQVPAQGVRAAFNLDVPLEDLKRLPKPPQEKEKQKKRHPTLLEDGGVILSEYHFAENSELFSRVALQNALMQSHMSTVNALVSKDSAGHVDSLGVQCFSEKTDDGSFKLPITLQARALKAVDKAKSLFLFPHTQDILSCGKETDLFLEKRQSNVDGAMLAHVPCSAQLKGKKRRRAAEEGESEPPTSRFKLVSPVVGAKDQKKRQDALTNLPPFWALLGAPTTHATSNMQLSTMLVSVPTCTNEGDQTSKFKFASQAVTCVELPFAFNTKPIAKGDVLMLPFQD